LVFDYSQLSKNRGHRATVRDIFGDVSEGFIEKVNMLGVYLRQSKEHFIFFGRDTVSFVYIKKEVA
jgi:hypothetical protein